MIDEGLCKQVLIIASKFRDHKSDQRPSSIDYDPEAPSFPMTFFNTIGAPYRWSRRTNFAQIGAMAADNDVLNATIEETQYDRYSSYRIIASVSHGYLMDLLGRADHNSPPSRRTSESKIQTTLNSLLREKYPDYEPRKFDEEEWVHTLFVEPKKSIYHTFRVDSFEQLIDDLSGKFDFATTVWRPVKLQDVILLRSTSRAESMDSLTAFRSKPFQSDEQYADSAGEPPAGIEVPVVPLMYCDHLCASELLRSFRERLSTQPILLNKYAQTHSDWNTFESYRKAYLNDRVRLEELILIAREAMDFVSKEYPASLLYSTPEHIFEPKFTNENNYLKTYSRSVSEGFERRRLKELKGLKASMKSITRRLRTLDASLRDYAIIDATNKNIEMAKTMKNLTLVVTAIALMSLVIAIVSSGPLAEMVSDALDARSSIDAAPQAEECHPPFECSI